MSNKAIQHMDDWAEHQSPKTLREIEKLGAAEKSSQI